MVEFLRGPRRRIQVQRQLLQLLRGKRLIICSSISNARGDSWTDLEAKSATHLGHHPFGILALRHVGGECQRLLRNLRELQQRRRLPERSGDSHHGAFHSRRIEHRLDPSGNLVARRLDPDRSTLTEQAHGPRFVRQRRRGGFYRCARDGELGCTHRPQQPLRECSRLRLVGAMKQKESDLRVRLVDSAADRLAGRLHLAAAVRVPYKARRAAIWSASLSASCSSAVCSAATVAYSELTMSMAASDPAVSSRSTIPLCMLTS